MKINDKGGTSPANTQTQAQTCARWVSEDIEMNEKIVNGIYLDKIVVNNYNLDSTQTANLDYVASQCPFSGGRSVYQARVIKKIFGDSTVYNDSLACVGLGYRITKKSNNPHRFLIKVSPNPVSENCLFSYQLPKDTPGKIEIYTLLGSKLEVIYLKANSNNIYYTPKGFANGLYHFRLIANKTIIGCGKIAIVR